MMGNKFLWTILIGTIIMGSIFAENAGDGLGTLTTAVGALCTGVQSLLPVIAILMVIGAGVIYAGGQFVGAETRSRANVWATNMMIGAIIALLITVIVPPLLVALGGSGTCTVPAA